MQDYAKIFGTYIKFSNEKPKASHFFIEFLARLFEGCRNDCSILDIGSGEGSLSVNIANYFRSQCNSVSYWGIDNNVENSQSLHSKLSIVEIDKYSLVQGDCFGGDLNLLPDHPVLIVASHIAYYTSNVRKFVDSLSSKMSNDTIIIFMHQSPMSGINALRKKYNPDINTESVNNIYQALNEKGFEYEEVMFSSTLTFPAEGYSETIDKFNYNNESVTLYNQNSKYLKEFLAQKSLKELGKLGTLHAFQEELNQKLVLNDGKLMIWHTIQVAIKKGSPHTQIIHQAAKKMLNYQNAKGFTELHCAAYEGNIEILEEMLDKGALVDTLSINAFTPLSIAVLKGHIGAVQLLVERGASLYGFCSKEKDSLLNEYHPIELMQLSENEAQVSLAHKYLLSGKWRIPLASNLSELKNVTFDFSYLAREKILQKVKKEMENSLNSNWDAETYDIGNKIYYYSTLGHFTPSKIVYFVADDLPKITILSHNFNATPVTFKYGDSNEDSNISAREEDFFGYANNIIAYEFDFAGSTVSEQDSLHIEKVEPAAFSKQNDHSCESCVISGSQTYREKFQLEKITTYACEKTLLELAQSGQFSYIKQYFLNCKFTLNDIEEAQSIAKKEFINIYGNNFNCVTFISDNSGIIFTLLLEGTESKNCISVSMWDICLDAYMHNEGIPKDLTKTIILLEYARKMISDESYKYLGEDLVSEEYYHAYGWEVKQFQEDIKSHTHANLAEEWFEFFSC
jgi:ankyrin repeat protein